MVVKRRRCEVTIIDPGPVVGVEMVDGVKLKVEDIEVEGTGRGIGEEGKRGSKNEVWP